MVTPRDIDLSGISIRRPRGVDLSPVRLPNLSLGPPSLGNLNLNQNQDLNRIQPLSLSDIARIRARSATREIDQPEAETTIRASRRQ